MGRSGEHVEAKAGDAATTIATTSNPLIENDFINPASDALVAGMVA
jgi:hypothetical protein